MDSDITFKRGGTKDINSREDRCKFCSIPLDTSEISPKDIKKFSGVSCPSCADKKPWKGPIAPPK